jgi:hypothetical protein
MFASLSVAVLAIVLVSLVSFTPSPPQASQNQ